MVHYDGATWEQTCSTPGRQGIRDFWGFASDDLWGIAGQGITVHWNGVEWIRGGAAVGVRAYALGGPRPDMLVSIGIDGNIGRYDGTGWTEVPKPHSQSWTEVVPAGNGVLVVGPGAVLWID